MGRDDDELEEFDSPPRPAKRRRLVGGAAKNNARTVAKAVDDNDDIDDFVVPDDEPPPKLKRGRPKKSKVVLDDSDNDGSEGSVPAKKATRRSKTFDSTITDNDGGEGSSRVLSKRPRATKKKQQQPVNLDSGEEGSIASAPSMKGKAQAKKQKTFDDLDDDGFAKPQKPKYKIHVPENNDLRDVFVDADAPPPSTNPWDVRGAIWKKDASATRSVFDVPAREPVAPRNASSLNVNSSHDPASGNTAHHVPSILSVPVQAAPVRPSLAKFMAPTTSTKQSDIPNSDDLDPEDWAGFTTDAVPFVQAATKAISTTTLTKSPSKPSDRIGTGKQPPSAPPLVPEYVDESIMSDDLDPEDWELLEGNLHEIVSVPMAHPPKASLSEGPEYRMPLTAGQGAQNHPPQQQNPFHEIEDDSMEEAEPFQAQPSKIPKQTNAMTATARSTITAVSILDELADLPSDAFDSDAASYANEPEEIVYVSSQHHPGQIRKPNLAAPKSGLVQTTLYGSGVQQQVPAGPTAKKHAWPLATQKEAETHHRLDKEAINTWVYPTNLGTIRDYQYNIVARGLFHNLLVALPTGLGKTFIAATVMLNWFRWAPDSQIVFVAPTKPLVAQQIDACFHVAGIPRSQTVMLTGNTKPAIRAEEWQEKRVFFMTPQTIINDLKHGYCDPKRIVLVVVDEAHRATGGYAYVEVVKFLRRFNQSFRVLALTATPGSTVESVQQVIDGLDISRVEIRTETSIDIRQYVHAREIDTMKFDFSDEQDLIMELLSKAIQPVLTKLNGQNAYWIKDPMRLTAYGCTMAQRQWSLSDAGKKAPPAIKGMVASIFPVLASLAHGISLLKFHGISPFYRAMVDFRNEVDGGQTKGKYAKQIREDENFNKVMNTVQQWTRNPDFLGHPKLEYLRRVVLNHFLDAKDTTRIMIFAHWRDSAEEIVRVLKRNEPMIRPHVFVGQATSKGSEGMGQKRQLEVIQQFKDGKYNTLVATSIGEEGLDIGEVDLIVCYDASSSPIRMLQRMGRTGRKRKGNIVLLLMRGKEEDDFEKAKDNYEKMQAMISEGTRFTFHDDKSPRILPREIHPVVDKRIVDIPVENSQAALPEPNRRKRAAKKPPKKFHMPDNVRTGFTTASKMDISDAEDVVIQKPRTKPKGKQTVASKAKTQNQEPETVALPFLGDVLLNKVQERELERKYQYVHGSENGIPTVTAPKLDTFAPTFPGPSRLVKHGRTAQGIGAMMERIRTMNGDAIQAFRANVRMSDLSGHVNGLLDEAEAEALSEHEAELPTLPISTKTRKRRAKPKTTNKGAAAPRTGGGRTRRNSSDMEGDESEPEPTPANMRIATQGIDLGSSDTMGSEEDDGEADSELAEFVVGSDAPIELASSSFPQIRGDDSEDDLPESADVMQRKVREVDSEIDVDNIEREERDGTVRKRRLQRGKRQVVDDESDE